MELKCNHHGNPSFTKLINHTQLHAVANLDQAFRGRRQSYIGKKSSLV